MADLISAGSGVPHGVPALSADRFEPANRKRLSGPALRTFLAICDLWKLGEAERRAVLGFPARSTYQNWVKMVREHRDITLDADVLMRISAVLGIHKALGILYSSEQEGVDWLHRAHQATVFGGKPPVELITNGTQDGLMTVRRFLDAARGGLYMEPNEVDKGFRPYTDADVVFS
ncbi:MbcA/ParS/Xre antitoxin family protein [Methylobacterium isbiliense]|uniref:Antitoxin Xre/MbcA/ParS-like toxin-binding domain-containing protein n=1 Tax=Methylobacterium isbiliense TaxID=315478 RepID=A0ABQ4SPV3_9HYPH|nr:MbcA/ParS/Xre antitoxin family protein [Methylobacterium isbiliense]MDN3626485.1 MbcA/ParS/Xre antitoxin family protein [Methylobacterium isbiliense]GJE04453.1 hypothetical protein GMJLKIPL_6417 [Methylobacterium isbiliense]